MSLLPLAQFRRKVPLAILAVLSVYCFFMQTVLSRAASPAAQKSSPSPAAAVPFEVGERFTYNVSWKVFDAGIATMTLAEKTLFQNEEIYRINATVYSTGIVSTLFKVVDVFESFFHTRELCSRRIVKQIQEGRRNRDTVVTFDPKVRHARMEDRDRNRPDLPAKRTESPIPACVQDVISALYVIRTKNLRVGDLIQFPINDGGRTYDVTVEIQAQEEVRTPAGNFQAFRLEPKVFDGLFKSRGRLFVWVTADAARMPVQLKAKINIGTITAALTQVDRPTVFRPATKP
ncbi:MAG: DUF3108 domain-containing protein [Acidobacteria bacterium]|nr:DUF3108 domain-containing protein [Acidobacteriota bacterium]MCI0621921.1 DUF3108 domain-containing protein [Acidobacteriota bacterium]MCI0719931.1 DUF3108 domain-containing protein [Acidobacteriota bacterium]